MITSNDSDAANELVALLGSGDFKSGAAAVNQFCQDHGFTSTRLEAPLTADSSEKTIPPAPQTAAAFFLKSIIRH